MEIGELKEAIKTLAHRSGTTMSQASIRLGYKHRAKLSQKFMHNIGYGLLCKIIDALDMELVIRNKNGDEYIAQKRVLRLNNKKQKK